MYIFCEVLKTLNVGKIELRLKNGRILLSDIVVLHHFYVYHQNVPVGSHQTGYPTKKQYVGLFSGGDQTIFHCCKPRRLEIVHI